MFLRLPADIQALATTPLFRDFSKRELAMVQRVGTIVDLGPRRQVSRPGESPAQFVVLVRGRVVATTALGVRRVLREGEWFGTIDCRGSAVVEPETYRTVVTTILFVMNVHEFAALQAVCPRFAARISGLTDLPPMAGRVTGSRVGTVRMSPEDVVRTGRATPHCLRPAMRETPNDEADRRDRPDYDEQLVQPARS